jgi:hypothetical protein
MLMPPISIGAIAAAVAARAVCVCIACDSDTMLVLVTDRPALLDRDSLTPPRLSRKLPPLTPA